MTARLARALPAVLAAALLGAAGEAGQPASAQTDLDTFMRGVVARRDDNWT